MARCYYCDVIIKHVNPKRRKALGDRTLCRTCIFISDLEVHNLWPENLQYRERKQAYQNFKYLVKKVSVQTVQECLSAILLKNSYSQRLLTKFVEVK